MRVCLDTNTLLQALDGGHPFNKLLTFWMEGRFVWLVSTPILLEYEEVITRFSSVARWHKVLRFFELAQATGAKWEQVTNWFQFQVIRDDPDDNIFSDCAITADADYVITEDRHFVSLKNAGFRVQPIKPSEFIERTIAGL